MGHPVYKGERGLFSTDSTVQDLFPRGWLKLFWHSRGCKITNFSYLARVGGDALAHIPPPSYIQPLTELYIRNKLLICITLISPPPYKTVI